MFGFHPSRAASEEMETGVPTRDVEWSGGFDDSIASIVSYSIERTRTIF